MKAASTSKALTKGAMIKDIATEHSLKAKAMKAASTSKALTKGAMIKDIATEHSLKAKEVSQIFDSLAAIATKEVKKNGVFTVPGLCRIKTRTKAATKAGTRICFGV